MLINIISWIVFGLVAGAVAKFLLPGNDPGGCLVTSLIGIAGAFVGGYLGQQFFGTGAAETWSWEGFVTAVLGAIVLLFAYRLLTGRNTSR
jgi:uncharacterized membrane protein YeaQ/YmgE (transglycosylase-associated protein family)